jgi:flagellar biosynthetic protein FliS
MEDELEQLKNQQAEILSRLEVIEIWMERLQEVAQSVADEKFVESIQIAEALKTTESHMEAANKLGITPRALKYKLGTLKDNLIRFGVDEVNLVASNRLPAKVELQHLSKHHEEIIKQSHSDSNIQLVLMLHTGLLDCISNIRRYIQQKNNQEKISSIARCKRIILGLQGALDFNKNEELANKLNELYCHFISRLSLVSDHNELGYLDEIEDLINTIPKRLM